MNPRILPPSCKRVLVTEGFAALRRNAVLCLAIVIRAATAPSSFGQNCRWVPAGSGPDGSGLSAYVCGAQPSGGGNAALNAAAAASGQRMGLAMRQYTYDLFHPNARRKAQEAAIADANARVEAALAAERDANARNDAAAAADAERRAEAARMDYIAERDKLASMMRGDDSAPGGMRGDDAGASGGMRGDDAGTAQQGLAMKQLLGAAMSNGNAACIMEGAPSCLKPVMRATVAPGQPPLPTDAARFVKSIPKSALADPKLKGWVEQYEHYAVIRGDAHDQMVRDEVSLKKDPDNQDKKLKVMEDAGNLAGAKRDEDTTKDTIQSFHIAGLAPAPAAPTKPARNTTASQANSNSNP